MNSVSPVSFSMSKYLLDGRRQVDVDRGAVQEATQLCEEPLRRLNGIEHSVQAIVHCI